MFGQQVRFPGGGGKYISTIIPDIYSFSFQLTVAWYHNACRHSVGTGFTTGVLEESGRSST